MVRERTSTVYDIYSSFCRGYLARSFLRWGGWSRVIAIRREYTRKIALRFHGPGHDRCKTRGVEYKMRIFDVTTMAWSDGWRCCCPTLGNSFERSGIGRANVPSHVCAKYNIAFRSSTFLSIVDSSLFFRLSFLVFRFVF